MIAIDRAPAGVQGWYLEGGWAKPLMPSGVALCSHGGPTRFIDCHRTLGSGISGSVAVAALATRYDAAA